MIRRSAAKRMNLLYMLALATVLSAAHAQRNVHAPLIDAAARKPAPAFHLTADSGGTRTVASFKGKAVLLDFWATECGGCVLELPYFIEAQQTHKGQPFTAVGVAMDIFYEDLKGPDEAWAKVRPFIASHKMNYPILMGDEQTSKAYDLQVYPQTWLLDKQGRVAAKYIGIVSKDDLEQNLQKLIAER